MLATILLVFFQVTPEDWQRSRGLYRLTQNKVVGGAIEPRWAEDGSFWYRDGQGRYVLVDPAKKAKKIVTKAELPGKTQASVAFDRPRQGGGARRADRSADGKNRIEIRDFNIVLNGKPLTRDGTDRHYFERGVYWSPDGSKFLAVRTKAGRRRVVNLIESSPKDSIDPKLHTFRYDKPGDDLDVTSFYLFDAVAAKEIPLDTALFPTPWSLGEVRWAADSQSFTFAYNQRGHQVVRILEADANSGKVRAIINEECKTFFDYAHKRFVWYRDKDIVWMSERDGWNHLYRVDRQTGQAVQLTKGQWVVRGVDRIDEKAGHIYFRAGGIVPDQSPYHVHFCRVNMDGSELTRLTDGDGTHKVQWSPDGKYLVDSWSRVDLAPRSVLRDATGKHLLDLDEAKLDALLKTGWQMPERFVAKGRDGTTDIWGVICKPTTFDPKKKYPVLEYIYAGPQSAFVPQEFRPFFFMQEMAELGFIVVQIDGMGTSHRSKAFHDVCWKNLGDSGFRDRIAWLKAAAQDRPWMDLSRVGIWGGSAGGQSSTRALLAHGDFYKVAVSDCGCHDNRVDKVWWNELWMGWPIGPHYKEQSNVTNAHRLKGKLMLVVGEMDRNVDPASTLQVVAALVKADKDFELLFLPGAGHGAAESPYGRRKRAEFFVKHLLGSK
jgi:dipeptidyl aminopeptidase/acylaminoacyl peptidase